MTSYIKHVNAWANVETNHLLPEEKAKALGLKEKWKESQDGKWMLKPNFKTGDATHKQHWAETTAELDILCDQFLEAFERRPQLLLLDTRGDSDMWKRKREEMDGFCKIQNHRGLM